MSQPRNLFSAKPLGTRFKRQAKAERLVENTLLFQLPPNMRKKSILPRSGSSVSSILSAGSVSF